MSRNIQVTFDAHGPRALSSFWRDVLGYVHPGQPTLTRSPRGTSSWRYRGGRRRAQHEIAIEDPDGHGPRLFFQ